MDDEAYKLHADMFRVLSHPVRLRIIDALRNGEVTLDRLVSAIGAAKGNVSQHLGQMYRQGVVDKRREGVDVYYWLTSPKVTEACDLMRELLLERLKNHAEIASKISSGDRFAGDR